MKPPHPYSHLPDLTGGLCLNPNVSADIWHPEGPGSRQQEAYAVSICKRCPVRTRCLKDVLSYEAQTGTRHGIYGGLSAEERAQLVKGAVA